ncbi:MAG TPA: hypothetical protein VM051_03210 [Usitatibacter sp.]|nr:hypothetical protein [Usitatibacter sp.]
MNPKSDQGNDASKQQTGQQQQQSGEGQQYGEGNYKAAREYNRGLKDHVEHHDIEKEARDAAPGSPQEAKELEDAERLAKSRSRGEGRDAGRKP